MDEILRIKLMNSLKSEAKIIMNSGEDITTKIRRMNDIDNMFKIIQDYDELEPLLKKFYKEKSKKEKWEER